MHRTARRIRTDPAARLAELHRQRPEWSTWLRLLGEVEQALDDRGWRAPLRQAEPDDAIARSTGGAPLLHHRTLELDPDRVRRLVRRLSTVLADSLGRYRPDADQSLGLVAAAVRQDPDALATMAAAAGVEADALTSVAHLAVYPILQSCHRTLAPGLASSWPHGYCPICAAWPVLAERRGLDRSRRLRCGRCAGEWEMEWLRCVYCGERDHRRLGSLVPEDGGEVLKMETCDSCRGYLKSVATLQEIPAFELLLRDLETVELDLVAMDRGYGRPEMKGFELEVCLA
jgi:FdhE protein